MNKLLPGLLFGGALLSYPIAAKAEVPMNRVMERVEKKGLIEFTSLRTRDEALQAAYGHFMPFDKVNVTTDGKLIQLSPEVVDKITALQKSADLDSLLSKNEDFYIAAKNGSFRVISLDDSGLVGTTDENSKTLVTDVLVDNNVEGYLRRIADKRDAAATEAYNLFNIKDKLVISLKGRKETIINNLADRLGLAMRSNSSIADVQVLTENTGLRAALDGAIERAGGDQNLGRQSKTTIVLAKSDDVAGRIDYEIKIEKMNSSLQERVTSGNLEESNFWAKYNMARPSEVIAINNLEDYLGLAPVLASADTTSTKETAAAEKQTVLASARTQAKKSREDTSKVSRAKGYDFAIVTGGYPMNVAAGLGKRVGPIDILGKLGYIRSVDDSRDVFMGDVDPNGNQIRIDSRWSEQGEGPYAGLNFALPINRDAAVYLGGNFGYQQLQVSGSSVPEQYKNGDLLRKKDVQPFSRRENKTFYSGNVGMTYKKVLVEASRDNMGRTWFNVGVKIPGGKK